MKTIRLAVGPALVALAALAPGAARAAIVITPGTNSASTPRLELDFGNGNPERVDSLKWRDSAGNLGGDLAIEGGAGGCDGAEPPNFWGESASLAGAPQPVGDGNTGGWTPRGGRTVEIATSRPDMCTADTIVTPVRTRYTFFNVGDAASKVRVERTLSFAATNGPGYGAASMRAYVPRIPVLTYSQVVYPTGPATLSTSLASSNMVAAGWTGTWAALNDPVSNAGVLILRESSSPAQLRLEADGNGNISAIDLLKPGAGWTTAITESEWLCFYDATSWPPGSRAPNTLPSGCSVVPVPISTAVPVIAGTPRVGTTLTTTTGSWDNASALETQWVRCGATCAAIPGATGASYTATLADEGRALRVDVTATAPGGEVDTASSAQTAAVATGPPQSTAPPTVSGEARQDETLAGTAGAWSSAPTSFQFQWLRCPTAALAGCADVPGATTASYKLTKDDVGAKMRLRVRATNGAGTSSPAESAATAEVQRFVLKAQLVVLPKTGCTGVNMTFDGSDSKTPNGPIVRYRVTYQVMPIPVFVAIIFGTAFGGSGDAGPALRQFLSTAPTTLLYDGKDASPSASFTWNRQLAAKELVSGKAGDYVRDPVYATLTVTDSKGATDATDPVSVQFAQNYSSQPRTACPRPFSVGSLVLVVAKAIAKYDQSAAVFALPCKGKIDCAGSLQVYALVAKKRGYAAKAKPVLLGSNRFFSLRGARTGTVRAKWTSAGRKLAKRKRPIRAVVKVTSVNPTTGKRTVSSKSLTIAAPKKKK